MRPTALRLGVGLVAAGLCAFGGREACRRRASASRRRRRADPIHKTDDALLKNFTWRSIGPANMGGRIDDIAVVEVEPVDVLRRVRDRRHVEDDEQRHDVHAGVRRAAGDVDRRHRHRAVESRRRLRRHRRAQQPPELVVRRGHLQVDRRRQEVAVRRAQGVPEHRAHRRAPEGSRIPLTPRSSATCSDRTRSAASTRRPTAARTGRTRNSSTKTRASPTW